MHRFITTPIKVMQLTGKLSGSWLVRAIFDRLEVEQGDLQFEFGDNMVVTLKDVNSGWWEGYRNGALGYIPSNYVEEIVIFCELN